MHSFEVHSNKSACRKSGHIGLEQVKCNQEIFFLSYIEGIPRADLCTLHKDCRLYDIPFKTMIQD